MPFLCTYFRKEVIQICLCPSLQILVLWKRWLYVHVLVYQPETNYKNFKFYLFCFWHLWFKVKYFVFKLVIFLFSCSISYCFFNLTQTFIKAFSSYNEVLILQLMKKWIIVLFSFRDKIIALRFINKPLYIKYYVQKVRHYFWIISIDFVLLFHCSYLYGNVYDRCMV
jgi:hypothetical protein